MLKRLATGSTEIVMLEANDFVVKEYDNGWEQYSIKLWEQELFKLQLGSTVWDVGAYTGIYSLISSKIRPDSRVVAFEPFPDISLRLLQNAAANEFFNIQCKQIALSDEESQSFLHVTGSSPLPSGSSIDPHPTKSDIRTVRIITKTGDDIIRDSRYAAPSLIKIDVEMAELKVLKGLSETIAKYHPTIFVELLTEDTYLQVKKFLFDLGYSSIDRINDQELTLDGDVPPKNKATNYLFK
jgi:FkbM family methyltransferase